MASKVIHAGVSGLALYFIVMNKSNLFWNVTGAAFEAYNSANWGDYDIPMTENGASGTYSGDFPAVVAALYAYPTYEQVGASPAEGDPVIGAGEGDWDGSDFVTVGDLRAYGDANWKTIVAAAVSAAVFINPANLLKTDSSGDVTAENMRGTDGANTTTPPTTSAIATAVTADMDGNSTQLTAIVADTGEIQVTLASGGAIRALIDTIVASTGDWDDGERLDLIFDASKVILDKLDSALEFDTPNWRFTTNALEQSPGGDATIAGQTAIRADITALNDPTSAAIASAVLASTVDGAVDLKEAMVRILAMAAGRIVATGSDPVTLAFYEQDGTTIAFSLDVSLDSSGRVVV